MGGYAEKQMFGETQYGTNMATGVNDHLALENQVEVIRLLVLNNSDLHGLTLVLVVKMNSP
jgi:hypothetical protein